MKLGERIWTQVDGDMDPAKYGGTIARMDGDAIELLKLQPTREYVGDGEAAEVGFPFWTREAYFCPSDLALARVEVQHAMDYVGLDSTALADMDRDTRAVAIACALLDYGHADEGPAGWAADVLPSPQRCHWWGSGKQPSGWRYLADEDQEFRALLRGES